MAWRTHFISRWLVWGFAWAWSVEGVSQVLAVEPKLWRQDVYVWQRQWTPEVSAAIEATAADVESYHVLAAEISWGDGHVHVARARPDFVRLKQLGLRVGLVLRIGPYSGSCAGDAEATREIAGVAAAILASARAAGVEPVELQIDYDCAESRLRGYAEWFTALRSVVGGVRLVFTALPVWLDHGDEFERLTRVTDGFVLQVHSLEKPANWGESVVLCDPLKALVWARRAAKFAVPFRVALPTYGYELAYTAGGDFFGLKAETGRRTWPVGTRTRVVRAEAGAMSRLAAALAAERLSCCEGVIWFRLPVESDRLNWDVVTFRAVLRGEALRAGLAAVVTRPEGRELAEVVLVNSGNLACGLPSAVRVQWPVDARLIASDSFAGYTLRAEGVMSEGQLQREVSAAEVQLAPGRKLRVAWLRFSYETSLQIELSTPPITP